MHSDILTVLLIGLCLLALVVFIGPEMVAEDYEDVLGPPAFT